MEVRSRSGGQGRVMGDPEQGLQTTGWGGGWATWSGHSTHTTQVRAGLTLSTARILAQMNTSSGLSSRAELCRSFST